MERSRCHQSCDPSAVLTASSCSPHRSYGFAVERNGRKQFRSRLSTNQLADLLALLQALKPKPGERDFRGFDWRYLSRLCLDSPSEVLAMNANGYRAVDFSPDGRTVALGTKDGLVELYDAPTRRRLKSWKAHTAAIDRLAT